MTSLLDIVGVRTGAICLAFALSSSVVACTDDGTEDMGDGDTMGDGDPGDGDPSTGDGDPSTGDGDGDPGGDLTYAGEIGPLFTASCSCHSSGGVAAATLTISHANLVDVASTQVPSINLVTTGDPGASYVINKMRGTHTNVGGSGNPMPPPPAGLLAETDIAMVEAWIDGGALP